nr:MAG TPA: hypothetical protein [Microviridae sp.]
MSCYKPLIRLYNPNDREQSGRVYSLARLSQLSGNELLQAVNTTVQPE